MGHVNAKRVETDRRRYREHREGVVYVIEFSSGTLKVGRTRDPKARLATYTKSAKTHGDAVLRSWFSSRTHAVWKAEAELIAFCRNRWELLTGAEYFKGGDFDQAVEFASNLPTPRLTDSEVDALLAEQAARVRGKVGGLMDIDAHVRNAHTINGLADKLGMVGALMNDANRAQSTAMAFDIAKQMMSVTKMPWAESEPDASFDYLVSRGLAEAAAREIAAEFENEICAAWVLAGGDAPRSFREMADFADQVYGLTPVEAS